MRPDPYPGPVSDDEPQWLSAEERQAWLALSRTLTTLPAALDAQLQRDAGLTTFEYLVLAMLSEHPGRRLPMSRLSTVTAGSLSRLSNVVTRLERRGLVQRGTDPDDRRVRVVELVEEGWQVLVAAAPAHVAHVRHLVVDALTPEDLAHLRDALLRVLDRVDPEGWSAIADPV